jgi:DNA-binding NarL/FixJ family response regulator
MTEKSRIVLADDHPIVLDGLRALIKGQDDLELIGVATTGLAALRIIKEQRPDIAVVDISMPELNGISLGRRLVDELPSVKVLVLTLHEDRAYLKQALDAGIRGYILKRSAAENLIAAIRAVLAGGLYIDPAIAGRIFQLSSKHAGRAGAESGGLELTERETEVLKLVALGFTNKEIARRLDIGVKSVETYRARGSEKLDIKTRAELVRYAAAQGWLADV